MTTPRPDDAATPAAVDVAAIRERWAKATPGPWEWLEFFRRRKQEGRADAFEFDLLLAAKQSGDARSKLDVNSKFEQQVMAYRTKSSPQWHSFFRPKPEDADAIAHAPQDIADLLNEVARLRAALEAGRGD